jgi:hypothetical protein
MEYRIGSFGNFDDYLKASYYIKDEETANQNGLEAIITEEENYIVGAFYDKNQFPKEYMFRLSPPKDKTAFILKITIEDLNSYYADKEEGKIKINAWVIELFMNVINKNLINKGVHLIACTPDNELKITTINNDVTSN